MAVITAQIAAGIIAFAIAVLIIPLVNKWARQFSLLDMPDDDRRKHALPTPRLGGIGIFVGAIMATAAVWAWAGTRGGQDATLPSIWPGILIGATIVFITGLEDGLFPLSRAFDDPPLLEEERRLFYVGITRAERKLYLAHARSRRRATC